ncbi:MAG: UDP-N-acetylmuramate--L-alanine ligase [Chloroflexi bacterium]|nr:UDP-N-acetylmuramate--L-alanine ligase [Chloroflexota bacterium]
MRIPQLQTGTKIHLVGIGGAGLSAIARILLERGCIVSGSDMTATKVTAALAEGGAQIFSGHDASYVASAELVLASSAVDDDHVELKAARQLGIPVYRRREFMPALLQAFDRIAVAGTHGKTTTTSMIIHILQSAGKDPSFIVGGTMGNSGRNAGVGGGKSFVIEADEYDNMFHGLSPDLAVVTTLEHDHPDFFPTPADMNAAFERFVASIAPGGLLVACADDEAALMLADKHRSAGSRVQTYAIRSKDADWRATDLHFDKEATTFTVLRRGDAQGSVSISAPGRHNVQNALAALAVAHERGVRFDRSAKALASFIATERRFEIRGLRDGVIVVDDYAHHPTEIEVNIQAARLRYPRHQIWAIWQPHTFSRVRQFWSEFIAAFREADRVLVTPIYAAREEPLDGVSSEALVAEMKRQFDATFTPDYDNAVAILRQFAGAPAVVLIFSAGDANRIADMYLNDEAK